ncbi:hypothetical protein NP493_655g01018 [Ridgeia piscesae]|uniref:Activator of Hsp90 ATPase AHSA1-like N-terminal domain-containing protein n=1 Tax=Ridgeia piscesae TaxID=27915 RepID=A0AAD9NRA0_RIDPI|nr:hypothetical protein NP493_655g01018 [Ridgeia piscesae]
MAKWGKGDPRWIVEERADATNVNNWHWTEKNATPWSNDKLKELLEGLKLENDKYKCQIEEVTKIEGEASASNRKAKLIFFYEWVIAAKWKGKLAGSSEMYDGQLEIPNLSEENDPEDIDVNVTVTTDDDEGHAIKDFLRSTGTRVIRQQIQKYIDDLKKEFSQGMILPTQTSNTHNVVTPPKNIDGFKTTVITNPAVNNSTPVGHKIKCKKLSKTEVFKCRAVDLYRALTNKDMLQAFTRSAVSTDAEKGGRFQLFDGNITGEYLQLEQDKRLEMKWRFKTWPAEHYSNVVLELCEKEDSTELSVRQTGIPESDYDRTVQGWNQYYWESIKMTFGFGAHIY